MRLCSNISRVRSANASCQACPARNFIPFSWYFFSSVPSGTTARSTSCGIWMITTTKPACCKPSPGYRTKGSEHWQATPSTTRTITCSCHLVAEDEEFQRSWLWSLMVSRRKGYFLDFVFLKPKPVYFRCELEDETCFGEINLFVCVTIIHSGAFKLLHWNDNLVNSWFWKVCVTICGSSDFWRTVPILIQQVCFLCHISRKHEIFLVNASLSIKNSCAKTNDKRH